MKDYVLLMIRRRQLQRLVMWAEIHGVELCFEPTTEQLKEAYEANEGEPYADLAEPIFGPVGRAPRDDPPRWRNVWENVGFGKRLQPGEPTSPTTIISLYGAFEPPDPHDTMSFSLY